MRKLLLAAAVLTMPLFGFAEVSEAACAGRIKSFPGQTVDLPITVKSGKRCSLNFRSSGSRETTTAESTHVVQKPSNGTVSVGSSNVTYQSRSGFTGSDTFIYARRGRDARGNSEDRRIRVLVTVTQ
jgi:Big-like domain-containing protein